MALLRPTVRLRYAPNSEAFLSYLTGSFVALITPFTEKNEVDFSALKKLIAWHIRCNTDGIVCLGTTAENPTLKEGEKWQIVKTCSEEIKGKIPFMVGTGSNDTQKAVFYTKMAKKLGAQAALVIVPYYNLPSEKGCELHFQKIAEIGLPLILYYHPKRTGITLSPSFILKLFQKGWIKGIKDGSGSLLFQKQLKQLGPIPILSGDDKTTLDTLKNTGSGSISVVANLIPSVWKKIHQLVFLQKEKEAEKLFQTYLPLIKAIFSDVNPQGIKCALALQKRCQNFLRLPLVPSDFSVEKTIKEELKQVSSLAASL